MQVDLEHVIEKLVAAYNIQVMRVAPPYKDLEKFDYGLRQTLDPQFDWQAFGDLLLQKIPANTLVFAEDVFGLQFAFCRLPGARRALLCIGPWTVAPRSAQAITWAEYNLTPEANHALEEYYNGVRIVSSAHLSTALYTLCSQFYPDGDFEAVAWQEFMPLNFRADLRHFNEPPFQQELPAAMVSQRYAAENRVLDAVTRGDTAAALAAVERFKRFRLRERLHNPLRERKNLAIIFNTLLRKAIERAAVHPYYIDRISTKYALRIENMASEEEEEALVSEMVQAYCLYVQRYSLRDYSPLVQKVINHINLNMDSQLSLKSLAAMCYISPSYLSSLFKQETGQTLTDYINTQRIQRAARRLCTTGDSVAATAEQVGILDVNYFTKIFKKVMGVTPTQYRREHHEWN